MERFAMKRHLPLATAVTLAIIIQLVGILVLQPTGFDSFEYLSISQVVLQDGEYSAPPALNGFDAFPGESPTNMRQPGYPMFLIVFYWLLGSGFLTVQLMQLLLNTLSLCLVYMTAKRIFRDRFRDPAILFVVLYFPWLLTSSSILTESLFTCILWLFVYSLARYQENTRAANGLISGVLLGALVLTKPAGLVIGITCSLAMLLILHWKRFMKLMPPLLLGTLLLILPWMFRNHISLGKLTFMPTTSGYNLWVASLPIGSDVWMEVDEFQVATRDGYYIDAQSSARFEEFARQNFESDGVLLVVTRAITRSALALSRFPGSGGRTGLNPVYIGFTLVQLVILGFAVVGIVNLKSRAAWLLIMPVVGLTLLLPLTKGLTRYLLPGFPAIALFAGQGFLCVFNRIHDKLRMNRKLSTG